VISRILWPGIQFTILELACCRPVAGMDQVIVQAAQLRCGYSSKASARAVLAGFALAL
jgi:hypothetical protein